MSNDIQATPLPVTAGDVKLFEEKSIDLIPSEVKLIEEYNQLIQIAQTQMNVALRTLFAARGLPAGNVVRMDGNKIYYNDGK